MGEELTAFRDALSAGGLHVSAAASPPLFSRVEVCVRLEDDFELLFGGQVVRPVAGGFFMMLDAGSDRHTLQVALEVMEESRLLASEEVEGAASEPVADAVREVSDFVPVWQLIDSTSDVPVRRQVQDLSLRDRLRLASHANRPVRNLLVRDIEKRVHVNVVKNPKVTDEEIMEYVAIPTLSPGALRWVSQQARLTRRPELRMKLIMNPQTPKDTAIKMMSTLNPSQLRRLMRSGRVRESIQRVARKKLMDLGVL